MVLLARTTRSVALTDAGRRAGGIRVSRSRGRRARCDRRVVDLPARTDVEARSLVTLLGPGGLCAPHHGVEPGRLEAHGHGTADPVADDASSQHRALDRCVEFHVIERSDDAGTPPAR